MNAAWFAALICLSPYILQTNHQLSNHSIVNKIKLKVPLRVYSTEGLLISEYGNERRIPLQFSDFPPILIQAVLATEDSSFYSHKGIDIFGLFRAAFTNFKDAQTKQGASTITMQVARNFFLGREKTYSRKLNEVFLAIRLEQLLSKQQILNLYLNKVFLGHRAYGFGAASEVYYGKQLNALSLAEIAMLAGLPKAPSSNNPLRNPNKAIDRRNHVLRRLLKLGYIQKVEYEDAKAAPITAQKHLRKNQLYAPYIAEMVRAELVKKFGESAYWEGLNVYTTVRAELQNAASTALQKGLLNYDHRHGFRGAIRTINLHKVLSAASIDPKKTPKWHLNVTPELEQHLLETLTSLPTISSQTPSIILHSTADSAIAFNAAQNNITLGVPEIAWAKQYKTQNLTGARPEKVNQVLQAGDIVYLTRSDATPPIDKWQLSQIPLIEGALVSMQPSTGKILALVGGYNYFQNKFNRATQSIRQAGSNIKPFIYSASLDKGYTPSSLINGTPIVTRDTQNGTVWRPENYSKSFFGPTRMRVALAKSLNLVSIRLLRAIGIPYAKLYLERFGFQAERFSPNLSLALGSGGITPLEMVTAYSALANSGYKITPQIIEKIENRQGEVLYQAPKTQYCDLCYLEYQPELNNKILALLEANSIDQAPDETHAENTVISDPDTKNTDTPIVKPTQNIPRVAPRIMSLENNFLTVSMLKDVIQTGTGRKALRLNRADLAGKTGTTNDYIDAWFSGFNPDVATTVWIGFDQPQSMGKGESGSKAALPIWVNYMQKISPLFPEEKESPLPNFVLAGFVDRDSGETTNEDDPNGTKEYFILPEFTPDYFTEKIGQLVLTGKISIEQALTLHLQAQTGTPETQSKPDANVEKEILTDNNAAVLPQTEAQKKKILEDEIEDLF